MHDSTGVLAPSDHCPAQFVFAYGSLAADLGGALAELRGRRRVWGVAMDNSRDLPAYKHYLRREDGSRPDVCVAFLDLVAEAGCVVNGVCVAVDDATLAALDERERNYHRIDVSTALTPAARGTVWAYVGSPESRARLRAARARGRAVISRDYLRDVKAGFAALGAPQLAALERSVDPGGLETWDLVCVPHSGRSRR